MADIYQVQIRSGTAAQVDAFTGAAGELTYDIDTGQLRVHDGSTVGGLKVPQAGSASTFGALTADSLDKAAIGTTNANTGNFTSLTATSLSVPSINGPSIGDTLANTGAFTSLSATSLSVPSINGPSIGDTLANTGVFTSLTATSLSVPSINGPSIGNTLANTGAFTSLSATSFSVPSINGPSIGDTLANTGAFTALTVEGTAIAKQGMPIVTNSANTKTLALTDSGSYIRFSNTTITVLTIPTNATVAFPTGTEVTGTGVANTVSIANSAGVTLNSKESLVTASAGGAFFLKKVDTNEWDLHGALE